MSIIQSSTDATGEEKLGVDKFIGRDHIHIKEMDAVQGFFQKEIDQCVAHFGGKLFK